MGLCGLREIEYTTINPMLGTGETSPFHGDTRKDDIIDYINGLVNDETISAESANYMFTKAYESYRLKDSDGNRTDEYDWSKLNSLPWN